MMITAPIFEMPNTASVTPLITNMKAPYPIALLLNLTSALLLFIEIIK